MSVGSPTADTCRDDGTPLDARLIGEPKVFRRRSELDGLRGVMALLVVAFHLRMPFFPQGYSGVDGFFVLSGFVISSILLREQLKSPSHSIDMMRFYARRAARLLPASLAVLLVTTVVYRWLTSDMLMRSLRGSLMSAGSFSENIFLIVQSADYFAFDMNDSPVMHYWSLAVEEQFYFVFPWAYGAFMRWARFQVWSAGLMGGAVVSLVVYQYSLVWQLSESYLYFGTHFRVYQLLSGVALGVVFFHHDHSSSTSSSLPSSPSASPLGSSSYHSMITGMTSQAMALTGFGMMVGISTPLFPCSSFEVGVISTVSTILLIVAFELTPTSSSIVAKLLRSQLMQALGRHSYAIYLWHYPLITLAKLMGWFPSPEGSSTVSLMVAILALAWLSWILVEAPAKKASQRMTHKQVVHWAMVAVILSTSMVYTLSTIELQSLSSPTPHRIPSNGSSRSGGRSSSTSISTFHSRPEPPDALEPTYILLGDSFAGEWNEALGEWRTHLNLTFQTHWHHGCPWFDVGREKCKPLHLYIPNIQGYHAPRVVFCVQFTLYQKKDIYYPDGRPVPKLTPEWATHIEEQMRAGLHLLLVQERVEHIIMIESHFMMNPLLHECLLRSAHCDELYPVVPFSELPDYAEAHQTISKALRRACSEYDSTRISWMNIDHVLAPDGMMRARDENGIAMWRDEEHLDNPWVQAHAMELVEPFLPFFHKYQVLPSPSPSPRARPL